MILYLIVISIINCLIIAVFGMGIFTIVGFWGNSQGIELPLFLVSFAMVIVSVIIPWVLHHFYKIKKAIHLFKWLSVILSLIPVIFVISWYAFTLRADEAELKRPDEEDIRAMELDTD